jgi:capsular polysaccharide biosynthesis protein
VKRSYVETFFRHRLLLIAPVVIAFVLAAAYGLQQPRGYVAGATLWTDRRIPADSAIGTAPGSDVPSAGQMALLTSLLASRNFMMLVAQDSPLADRIQGPQLDVDLALARLAATVSVATPGPQVMAIVVRQPSPELATGVASAVVRQFMREEERRIRARATAQITYDKQQLSAASKAVRTAEAALLAYTRTHPGAGQSRQPTSADTTLNSAETSLVGALALAQQNYSEAAKAYNASTAAYTQANTAALEVLDQPNQAFPQGRKKIVIFCAVGGLLAGLSISVVALLLLVTRDRAVRDEADLQQALGLRVVGTIDEFSKRRRLAFAGKSTDLTAGLPKGQP